MVRKFTVEASTEHITNASGALESRQYKGRFNTQFSSSDQFTFEATNNYELLEQGFAIRPEFMIAPGRYGFSDVTTSYSFGQQRRISGAVVAQRGQLYNGTVTAFGYTAARVSITRRFALEPNVSVTRLHIAGRRALAIKLNRLLQF